ncbi:MAG TPA: Holliday junction branch migration protein RuvA [Candidatus Dormibacteraeota bacterium]|nr:Holliday junction branch migration protein RuvA [Candidatus Dormibacteraeota bacterium]
MIATLSGRIGHLGPDSVVVEVGGVGYLVTAPGRLLASLGGVGAEVKLFTHTYVREDQLALYGFASMEDLEFFELLMSVKGIGPKVAIGMISQSDTRTLKKAVFQEDRALLATVPGIGPKTAARVILELRDKLKEEYLAGPSGPGAGSTGRGSNVAEAAVRALASLGYREVEVRKVVAGMGLAEGDSLESAVSQALKALDRKA